MELNVSHVLVINFKFILKFFNCDSFRIFFFFTKFCYFYSAIVRIIYVAADVEQHSSQTLQIIWISS